MKNTFTNNLTESPSTQHFEQQISARLESYEQLFAAEQFIEAYEQLYRTLNLLEQINNPQLKNRVLVHCVKASNVIMAIDDAKNIISSTIASLDDIENLSMCYFLLSQSLLQEKNINEAIMHAKMAYFYAQQVDGNRLFYVCNAQLQLVCSLLEGNKCEDAKYYIDQFNWYLTHCKNDAERVFVLSMQASIQLLEQNEEAAITTMTTLLEKFSHSQNIMYTSLLAMHFKRMLQLQEEHAQKYQAVISQCEQLTAHFSQFSAAISKAAHTEYMMHSNCFYYRAHEMVENQNERQFVSCLLKFKLLYQPEIIEALLACFHEKNVPHLLYQYAYGHFMFLTSEDGYTLFEHFIQQEQALTHVESVHMKNKHFLDLYNELNTLILNRNLAAFSL